MQRPRREVLLVTSGAIGIGSARLQPDSQTNNHPCQTSSSCSWAGSLCRFTKSFSQNRERSWPRSCLLRADLGDRQRYLNAKNALDTLFSYEVIPIVNENDTVAVDEIKIGDNDTLAANITALIGADLLVILSDVEGLYTADPRLDPAAKKIDVIEEITPEIEQLAGQAGSTFGTGGMQTKLAAARIATKSGAAMAIVHGGREGNLAKVLSGQCPGTLFLPQEPLAGRKMWLAFNPPVCGKIIVDEGARTLCGSEAKAFALRNCYAGSCRDLGHLRICRERVRKGLGQLRRF